MNEMNNILIRGYEIKYERNFSNCVKKPEKFRAWTHKTKAVTYIPG